MRLKASRKLQSRRAPRNDNSQNPVARPSGCRLLSGKLPGCRALCVDLPGHGKSGRAHEGEGGASTDLLDMANEVRAAHTSGVTQTHTHTL